MVVSKWEGGGGCAAVSEALKRKLWENGLAVSRLFKLLVW